jgi:hypothetical protein
MNNDKEQMPAMTGNPVQQADSQMAWVRRPHHGYHGGYHGGFHGGYGRPPFGYYNYGTPFLGGLAGGLLASTLFPYGGGYGYPYYGYYPPYSPYYYGY